MDRRKFLQLVGGGAAWAGLSDYASTDEGWDDLTDGVVSPVPATPGTIIAVAGLGVAGCAIADELLDDKDDDWFDDDPELEDGY